MHRILPFQDTQLALYVHSFNLFDNNVKKLEASGHSKKMVPDALADIWFCSGDPIHFSFDGKKYFELPKAFAWGLTNEHCFMYSEGVSKVFSIKIYPWAFSSLFHIYMEELRDSFIALSEFCDDHQKVYTSITTASTDEDRVSCAESFVLCRLADKKDVKPYIIEAYNAILESRGNIQIASLAKDLGKSRQYLGKEFKRCIGLSIKEYIGVFRTRLCIDFQLNNAPPSLTELSYEFDFFDQAHFIRQFKSVVGETPRVFFSNKHLIKQHMRD